MMSTENRFQPPRAGVADVRGRQSGQYQPVRLWTREGRIGRLRYLAYLMGGYALVIAGGFVLGLIGGALGMGKNAAALGMIAAIPYFVFSILLLIKRSHDMDWSAWSILLAFIPLIGLIWLFKAGTPGENKYGAPPPPNTTGVKVLGLMMPVIALIGILAAVAIPQYAKYTQRAKAAQMNQQQQGQQAPAP
jgi:uncharacterized membrane protein YhaH (DUF805 family)